MNSTDTIECLPHSLPFAVLMEELRERWNDEEFLLCCRTVPGAGHPVDVTAADTAVEGMIALSDRAYAQLASAKEDLIAAGSRRYADDATRDAAILAMCVQAEAADAACRCADAPLRALLHAFQSSAICLSGGGIRSASFSLGILQALSQFDDQGEESPASHPRLLHRLTYLSTVSGGGYIGSWLIAWARRSSFGSVVHELANHGSTSADQEAGPLRHLRSYTSYLAPRPGFSADAATLFTIVLRNLTLNWLIFLPAFMLFVSLPWMERWLSYRVVVGMLAWADTSADFSADELLMWASAIMLCISGWIAAWRFWHKPTDSKAERSLRLYVLYFPCICLCAWLAAQAWRAGVCTLNTPEEVINSYNGFQWEYFRHIAYALLLATAPLTINRMYVLWACSGHLNARARTGSRLKVVASLATSTAAVCATAAVIEIVMIQAARHLPGWNPTVAYLPERIPRIYDVIALPIALLLLMLGSTLLSGLISAVEREEEREWWARSGGVLFLLMFAWVVLQSCAWYGPELLHHLGGGWHGFSIPLLGLTTGGAASLAASSAGTSSGLRSIKPDELSKGARFIAKHPSLTPLLGAVAIVLLVISVVKMDDLLIRHARGMALGFFPSGLKAELLLPSITVGALLVSVITNFCINVNIFSLHGMYRMRLVRAFLGASNFARAADPVTNFDPKDDMPLAYTSQPCDGSASQGSILQKETLPIHLVCATLNLVATKELAWQQRKAEPFSFSRLRCGSWRLGYAATARYGDDQGVSLGTAMAISGAAISPNMGYNSSPALTFLMTLFNLRLGWWLPNPVWPARQAWSASRTSRFLRRRGPDFALLSMLSEALGRTNDSGKWLQLSDGGHFENLGLYEMVMRRCHRIIVVDADADGEMRMEDLGNALRKIRIDLGISIRFKDGLGIGLSTKVSSAHSARFCSVGTIEYSSADGPDAPDGKLLFLKARKVDDEPVDVASYAAAHDSFPNESTANQFFTEAQFESYRALGFTLVKKITTNAIPGGRRDMDELLELAEKLCCEDTLAAPLTGM